jgi:hypothetical protein
VATIYVSYRSTEEPFVRAVVSRLEQQHDVRIDYNMPAGVDWRSHQLEDLRACDVFLVFVSQDTRTSDFQNAEMGGAVLPDMSTEDTYPGLDDLSTRRARWPIWTVCAGIATPCHCQGDRERDRTAGAPDSTFISHAHRGADIAARLVDGSPPTWTPEASRAAPRFQAIGSIWVPWRRRAAPRTRLRAVLWRC